MKDILGKALLDYHRGNYSEDLITETNLTEADELSLPYLFRGFEDMPAIEQQALRACKGHVLDIGCGSGSHALWLQDQGLEVTAIDVSPGAIQVARERGVKNVYEADIRTWTEGTYDTLLLLMNGTGIFKYYDQVSAYLQHLKTLLKPNGQILIDSSDLRYLYDSSEDGGIWVPGDHYYGELEFVMHYKGETSEPFPWLYLDPIQFESLAKKNGFAFHIQTQGDYFDYLARLTV